MSYRRLRILELLIGAITGALLGVFLAEKMILLALLSYSIGITVYAAVSYLIRRKMREEEAVLIDEMAIVIAEKSGLLALKASVMAISILLIATALLPRFGAIPARFEMLLPGLGLSMAILVVAYWLSYLYYTRSKGPIEGR